MALGSVIDYFLRRHLGDRDTEAAAASGSLVQMTKYLVANPSNDVPPIVINPLHPCSIGAAQCLVLDGSLPVIGTGNTGTNVAVYVPFQVGSSLDVKRLWISNGATIDGNFDVGIYDASGTRLVASGSTAHAGANDIQAVTVSLTLTAGQYYLAYATSSGTATLFTANVGASQYARHTGLAQESSAFPLPATATLAAYTLAVVPIIGLSARTLV